MAAISSGTPLRAAQLADVEHVDVPLARPRALASSLRDRCAAWQHENRSSDLEQLRQGLAHTLGEAYDAIRRFNRGPLPLI